MHKCYKNDYISNVIVRLDFSARLETPTKGLGKDSRQKIMEVFNIPEQRKQISQKVTVSPNSIQEEKIEDNVLIFHNEDRTKSLIISSTYASIELVKYESFDTLKSDFKILIDSLLANEEKELSISRFGLRYINQIEINESNYLDWGEYINDNLFCGVNICNEKKNISRFFSTLVERYPDDTVLSFQYGSYNPNYPSVIKNKLFVLDYDASQEGVFEVDSLMTLFDRSHEKVENLFEKSIKQPLRDLMNLK